MIRIATVADVPAINHLRLQVKENRLSDPSVVTEAMTTEAITQKGRGWVADHGDEIRGFSIALTGTGDTADGDYAEPCLWALFVHPNHEARGLGRELYQSAEDWLLADGAEKIWLSTEGGTRAETFYRRKGWRPAGQLDNGDLKFVLER